MEHLITVTRNKGKKVVSARELHEKLESKQDFSNWIKGRIEKFGFQENKDFTIILSKSTGGRPTIEYALTLDMAKELGMLEGNDIGKQIRRYFIEVEKKSQPDFTPISGFEDHTKPQIQKLNSREVNTFNYETGGVKHTIEYNTKNCYLHTGKTPAQIRKFYANANFTKTVKKNAKELIRRTDPITSCAMSLTDNLVKLGGDHEKAAHVSNTHGREVFKFMIENGMTPGELNMGF